MFRNLYLITALIVILPAFSYALSGGGGDTGTIPIPAKDFSAGFTDMQNVQTTAKKVSWEGKIFIEVQRGNYALTIPFEKIKSIEININSIDKNGNVPAIIETVEEKIDVKTNGNKKIYGETSYGTFQVFVKNLKKIEFTSGK